MARSLSPLNKLPVRYHADALRMQERLLLRLITSTKPGLKPYRYAAYYRASWRVICRRTKFRTPLINLAGDYT